MHVATPPPPHTHAHVRPPGPLLKRAEKARLQPLPGHVEHGGHHIRLTVGTVPL